MRFINCQIILERKEEFRDLGILVDHRFNFVQHIEQIISSARQCWGCIKSKSRNTFMLSTQKLLYTSFVRSKLEFGSVIWDPYQQIYQDDIESVQKSFLIYLLETNNLPRTTYRLSPYVERCALVKLDTLKKRRNDNNMLFAFDIFNNVMNDTRIATKFNRFRTDRILRFNRLLIVPTYLNDHLKYQPIVKMMNLVNEYCTLFDNISNKSAFKARLKQVTYNQTED